MVDNTTIGTLNVKVDTTDLAAAGAEFQKFQQTVQQSNQQINQSVSATQAAGQATGRLAQEVRQATGEASNMRGVWGQVEQVFQKSSGSISGIASSFGGVLRSSLSEVGALFRSNTPQIAAHAVEMEHSAEAAHQMAEAGHILHPILGTMGVRFGELTSLTRLTHAGLTAVAAAIGGILLNEIEKAADATDKLKQRLSGMAPSSDSAKAAFEGLKGTAQATGISADELNKSLEALLGTYKEVAKQSGRVFAPTDAGDKARSQLGISVDDMNRVVKTMAEMFDLARVDSKSAGKAMEEFFQSISKGGLTLDVFEKLKQAAPSVASSIEKALGFGDIDQKLQAGPIKLQNLLQTLLRMTPQVDSEFAKAPKSMAQTVGQLTDAWDNFLEHFGRTEIPQKVVGTVSAALNKLAEDVEETGPKISETIDKVSEDFRGLSDTVGGVSNVVKLALLAMVPTQWKPFVGLTAFKKELDDFVSGLGADAEQLEAFNRALDALAVALATIAGFKQGGLAGALTAGGVTAGLIYGPELAKMYREHGEKTGEAGMPQPPPISQQIDKATDEWAPDWLKQFYGRPSESTPAPTSATQAQKAPSLDIVPPQEPTADEDLTPQPAPFPFGTGSVQPSSGASLGGMISPFSQGRPLYPLVMPHYGVEDLGAPEQPKEFGSPESLLQGGAGTTLPSATPQQIPPAQQASGSFLQRLLDSLKGGLSNIPAPEEAIPNMFKGLFNTIAPPAGASELKAQQAPETFNKLNSTIEKADESTDTLNQTFNEFQGSTTKAKESTSELTTSFSSTAEAVKELSGGTSSISEISTSLKSLSGDAGSASTAFGTLDSDLKTATSSVSTLSTNVSQLGQAATTAATAISSAAASIASAAAQASQAPSASTSQTQAPAAAPTQDAPTVDVGGQQEGGDYQVPSNIGSGPDSVQLTGMVSPGERISFTPPGEDDDGPGQFMPPLDPKDPWAAFRAAQEHQQQWGMPGVGTQLSDITSKTAQMVGAPVLAAKGLTEKAMSGEDVAADPESIRQAADIAMSLAGGGAFGAEKGAFGTLGGKGLITPGDPGFTVYHGSPHSFKKFDMSKLGTGEGAIDPELIGESGHGMYLSKKEDEARWYRNQLSDVKLITPTGDDIPITKKQKAYLNVLKYSHEGPLEDLLKDPLEDLPEAKDAGRNEVDKWLRNWSEMGAIPKSMGHMYEVNIKADPKSFLDWDKMLADQTPGVKESLRALSEKGLFSDIPNYKELIRQFGSGGNLYEEMVGEFGAKDTVGRLRKAGIPGTTYEGVERGARNYTVFNDKLLKIIRKYGLAGMGITGAGVGSFGDQSPAEATEPSAPMADIGNNQEGGIYQVPNFGGGDDSVPLQGMVSPGETITITPASQKLAQTMTHQAPGPDPARPYLDIVDKLAAKLNDALMVGPKLMGDVMEGRIDAVSTEAVQRAVPAALSVVGYGSFGAEIGAGQAANSLAGGTLRKWGNDAMWRRIGGPSPSEEGAAPSDEPPIPRPPVTPHGADPWAAFKAAQEHQQQWGMPGAASQVQDIVGKIVGGAVQAAASPITGGADLMQKMVGGELSSSDPEAVRRSTNVVGGLAGYGVMGAEKGTFGVFGGRGAYPTNPVKRAENLEKMSQAEALEASGVSPEDIWNKTGRARGAEGQWRFEIPDFESELTRKQGKGALPDFLNHPDLYEAYPQLKYLNTELRQSASEGGSYASGGRSPAKLTASGLEEDPTLPSGLHATVMHEVQHAIQDVEGFAKGGNIKRFGPSNYHNLAGEVEARNVEERLMGGDPGYQYGRYGMLPEGTEDVPRSEQIVKRQSPSDMRKENPYGGYAGPGFNLYHGSPHDFSKFDVSKLGTGEGASSPQWIGEYGHGMYFSTSEDVAKWYRNQYSDVKLTHPTTGADIPLAPKEKSTLDMLKEVNSGPLEDLFENLDDLGGGATAAVIDKWQKMGAIPKSMGHMYEANIKADPEQFLDLDKTLMDQSDHVKRAIAKMSVDPMLSGNTTGYDLLQRMQGGAGGYSGSYASNKLMQAGIPGTTYTGETSGVRNYVVFDDKLIDIVRKYGLAGMGITGSAAAAGLFGDMSQAQAKTPSDPTKLNDPLTKTDTATNKLNQTNETTTSNVDKLSTATEKASTSTDKLSQTNETTATNTDKLSAATEKASTETEQLTQGVTQLGDKASEPQASLDELGKALGGVETAVTPLSGAIDGLAQAASSAAATIASAASTALSAAASAASAASSGDGGGEVQGGIQIGAQRSGGIYVVGGSGAPDSIQFSGHMSPGETMAILPPGALDSGLLTDIQNALGGTEISMLTQSGKAPTGPSTAVRGQHGALVTAAGSTDVTASTSPGETVIILPVESAASGSLLTKIQAAIGQSPMRIGQTSGFPSSTASALQKEVTQPLTPDVSHVNYLPGTNIPLGTVLSYQDWLMHYRSLPPPTTTNFGLSIAQAPQQISAGPSWGVAPGGEGVHNLSDIGTRDAFQVGAVKGGPSAGAAPAESRAAGQSAVAALDAYYYPSSTGGGSGGGSPHWPHMQAPNPGGAGIVNVPGSGVSGGKPIWGSSDGAAAPDWYGGVRLKPSDIPDVGGAVTPTTGDQPPSNTYGPFIDPLTGESIIPGWTPEQMGLGGAEDMSPPTFDFGGGGLPTLPPLPQLPSDVTTPDSPQPPSDLGFNYAPGSLDQTLQDLGSAAPIDDSSAIDLGDNQTGGLYMIANTGGGADSISMQAAVSPGETLAILPQSALTPEVLSTLQDAIGKSPVTISGNSQGSMAINRNVSSLPITNTAPAPQDSGPLPAQGFVPGTPSVPSWLLSPPGTISTPIGPLSAPGWLDTKNGPIYDPNYLLANVNMNEPMPDWLNLPPGYINTAAGVISMPGWVDTSSGAVYDPSFQLFGGQTKIAIPGYVQPGSEASRVATETSDFTQLTNAIFARQVQLAEAYQAQQASVEQRAQQASRGGGVSVKPDQPDKNQGGGPKPSQEAATPRGGTSYTGLGGLGGDPYTYSVGGSMPTAPAGTSYAPYYTSPQFFDPLGQAQSQGQLDSYPPGAIDIGPGWTDIPGSNLLPWPDTTPSYNTSIPTPYTDPSFGPYPSFDSGQYSTPDYYSPYTDSGSYDYSSDYSFADSQTGNIVRIPNTGGGADSVSLQGMVSPGEAVAIIPSHAATDELMAVLQEAIGKSPITLGQDGAPGALSRAAMSTPSPQSEPAMDIASSQPSIVAPPVSTTPSTPSGFGSFIPPSASAGPFAFNSGLAQMQADDAHFMELSAMAGVPLPANWSREQAIASGQFMGPEAPLAPAGYSNIVQYGPGMTYGSNVQYGTGYFQSGGIIKVPNSGGNPDSVSLQSMVSPGEVVAIIPSHAATEELMGLLQVAIGKSPITLGQAMSGMSNSDVSRMSLKTNLMTAPATEPSMFAGGLSAPIVSLPGAAASSKSSAPPLGLSQQAWNYYKNLSPQDIQYLLEGGQFENPFGVPDSTLIQLEGILGSGSGGSSAPLTSAPLTGTPSGFGPFLSPSVNYAPNPYAGISGIGGGGSAYNPFPNPYAPGGTLAGYGGTVYGGGVFQTGGIVKIPNSGGGPDSVNFQGMVSPGEVVAVIPQKAATDEVLGVLQEAIGKSPVTLGPSGMSMDSAAPLSITSPVPSAGTPPSSQDAPASTPSTATSTSSAPLLGLPQPAWNYYKNLTPQDINYILEGGQIENPFGVPDPTLAKLGGLLGSSGGTTPSGPAGGSYLGPHSDLGTFAEGSTFMVPPEVSRITAGMELHSGEKVDITPANKSKIGPTSPDSTGDYHLHVHGVADVNQFAAVSRTAKVKRAANNIFGR